MINANELRIGNWINLKMSNEEWEFIEVLSGDHIDNLTNNRPDHGVYETKGIWLTPEILEGCGFKKKERFIKRGKYYFVINNTTIVESLWFDNRIPHIQWNLKGTESSFLYLHQLQNLFFALIGTELEINLPVPA